MSESTEPESTEPESAQPEGAETGSTVPSPSARSAARRRTLILIAPAVAVVLAVAAGVWAYDSSRGRSPAPPKPSSTGLVRAWSAGAAGLDTGPAGAWLTGRDVVVNAGNGLVADSLASGRADWRWQPPAGTYFDDMSPAADLGIAVVAYGTGASPSASPSASADPDTSASATAGSSPAPSPSAESGIDAGPSAIETVAGLDLATGRVLWTTPLAYPIGWPGPVVGDGSVAVLEQSASGGFGALDVLDLSTGEPSWSTASDAAIPAGCAFTSAAISGGLVYAAAQCSEPAGADADATAPGTEILYGFAPDTGAIQNNTSTSGFICADPDQSTYATLWSAAGYLLVSCSENTTTSQPLWIRATGAQKLLAAHFVSQTDPLSYEFRNLEYPAFAAAGPILYVQVLIPGAGGAGRPAVTAIDLRTGRQLWQQPVPGGVGYLAGADSTGATVALENGGTLSLARFARSGGTVAYGPGAVFAAAAGTRAAYRVLAAGALVIAILPGDPAATVTGFRRASAR
ncbi:MAG TPA: PQQ-binding-like beta-propeller repeat protein [Actinocrinis sp.]